MRVVVVVLFCVVWACAVAQECAPRQYGHDSVVCVCNATHCDNPGTIDTPDDSQFTLVTSSRDGLRFQKTTVDKETVATPDSTVIQVDRSTVAQTILGFGGAITDAAALTLYTLSTAAQDNFIGTYFSGDGIGYNLCRVPIAGSDCSTRPYSYDDVAGDVDLQYFALAEEDVSYKIPLILRAMAVARTPIRLFGSPWSPPAWMKTNGKFNESGELIEDMWQPWSNYFVKFVEAYEAAGVEMWGLTTQNEPLSGFDDSWAWNTCGWTAEDMRDWVKTSLGPTLQAAGMRRLQLMVDDFNRDTLPWYVQPMLEDPDAAQYIDGTAVHWYSDQWVDASVLDETQALFPDKYILHTEACEGWDVDGPEESVQLGSWDRAQNYAFRIIENLNHYTRGWVDWNIALNTEGGPNWANNYLDSPIIINGTADEFYKEPLFYVMGHFSKFVMPGFQHIASSSSDGAVYTVAFLDSGSSTTIIVLLNTAEDLKPVSVDDGSASYLNFDLPAKAITTVIYTV